MGYVKDVDDGRLVTKVARLYHVRGLRQGEIAERLRLSQSRVSRLLDRAGELGIVRNIVSVPPELHRDLERGLFEAYKLQAAHVVDVVGSDDTDLPDDLGRAAAPFVTAALSAAPAVYTVGFTSWSRTLRKMVEVMRPMQTPAGCIVEMLGDLGAPTLQQDVAQTTQRFATLTSAAPAFLRVPGVLTSPMVRDALLHYDPHAREVVRLLDSLDLALLSIGPCDVVGPLQPGDRYFTQEQFDEARRHGAVGQVCLRFLDSDGNPVPTALDDLVLGVSVEQLRRARNRWAVAGGEAKYAVLHAALVGRWVDHLVTDTATADHLLQVAS